MFYKNNCTFCSVASYLRTKGYDVIAKDTGGKQQMLGGVVENCFKGAKVIDGSAVKFGKSPKDASEMLVNKFGNNASGVVSVQWKKSSPLKGGHIFNWEIKDGVVKFFDGQNNRDDSKVSGYWNFINANDSLTIARLDNAEINFDAIKKYVTNR
ncbi:toxin glutamine deamidase domain-containing protein [[Ruminococcus] lactaris]|uniref:toxin glutamine deamidase domain-containing protein n=1 Tax=[Ruminococcus] lactaris TaxID=46228 RepID=UPI0039F4D4F0